MLPSPFALDRSPTAELIRQIGTGGREVLEEVVALMMHQADTLSYARLEQIHARADAALGQAFGGAEQALLETIRRGALWRMQRMHIEDN